MPPRAKDPQPEKGNAQLKRHLREKKRRERRMRQRPPGAKEKFVAGCIAVGLLAFLTLIAVLTWTCFFGE